MASAVRGSSAKRKPDLRRRSGYGVPVQTEKSLEKLNKKALCFLSESKAFLFWAAALNFNYAKAIENRTDKNQHDTNRCNIPNHHTKHFFPLKRGRQLDFIHNALQPNKPDDEDAGQESDHRH